MRTTCCWAQLLTWTLSIENLKLPSHNAGCQAGEAPWTDRRTVATCWVADSTLFLNQSGVSHRRWNLLLGCRVAVRADWERGVPETVGGVAGSSLSTGLRCILHLGRLAKLGEILLAVGQGCLAGRGEARLGKFLSVVGGGLLLG